MSTRSLRGLLLPLSILASAGCVSVPPPERISDRLDPFETLSGFVYSVETGQWDWAHECLTQESRGLLSRSRMRNIIEDFEFPGSKVSLHDVILRATRRRDRLESVGDDYKRYKLEYERGSMIFHLVRTEDGLWQIDLARSIQDLGVEP